MPLDVLFIEPMYHMHPLLFVLPEKCSGIICKVKVHHQETDQAASLLAMAVIISVNSSASFCANTVDLSMVNAAPRQPTLSRDVRTPSTQSACN